MSSPIQKVPRRPFGSGNPKLPTNVPIVGLGCSSFSSFFWTPEEQQLQGPLTVETITKDHPRVQEWIQTIHFAVLECGITLLDTAPWYGHGTSEIVIGYAMEKGLQDVRSTMTINTKVGRYEADPAQQFDFSYTTTLASIQRSMQRMKCDYIDVLQLHDPEFAPTMDQLMQETIPAMRQAQTNGWCKALGMTGYPLEIQYQILQRSMEVFGTNVWDQALTYGHYNLHNTRLTTLAMGTHSSYAEFCQSQAVQLLAAAPLSMGLLTPPQSSNHVDKDDDDDTNQEPKFNFPVWHPASLELQRACQEASLYCQRHGINIATLAIAFALANSQIACTILGCKNVDQVQQAVEIANRFHGEDRTTSSSSSNSGDSSSSNGTTTMNIWTENESKVLRHLLDPELGPFATVWKKDLHHWDGIGAVFEFWRAVPSVSLDYWQRQP